MTDRAKRGVNLVSILVLASVVVTGLVLLTEQGQNYAADFGKAKKEIPEEGYELKFRYQQAAKHLPADFTQKCCARVLEDFDLQSLESLSDQEAQVLGTTHVGTLRLSAPSLSVEAAKGLGHHQGGMFFSGASQYPDEVLIELAKSVGPLSIKVASMSEALSKALGQHSGELYLDDLTFFSVADARNFANHSGDLHLNQAEFAAGAPELLVDHPGSIYIGDLGRFPWPVAEKMISNGQRLSFFHDRGHTYRAAK